jgi:hypothetical protein
MSRPKHEREVRKAIETEPARTGGEKVDVEEFAMLIASG